MKLRICIYSLFTDGWDGKGTWHIGGNDKCKENFSVEASKKGRTWETLAQWRIILKRIFRNVECDDAHSHFVNMVMDFRFQKSGNFLFKRILLNFQGRTCTTMLYTYFSKHAWHMSRLIWSLRSLIKWLNCKPLCFLLLFMPLVLLLL
jgi:hypothetical protein